MVVIRCYSTYEPRTDSNDNLFMAKVWKPVNEGEIKNPCRVNGKAEIKPCIKKRVFIIDGNKSGWREVWEPYESWDPKEPTDDDMSDRRCVKGGKHKEVDPRTSKVIEVDTWIPVDTAAGEVYTQLADEDEICDCERIMVEYWCGTYSEKKPVYKPKRRQNQSNGVDVIQNLIQEMNGEKDDLDRLLDTIMNG